MLIFFENPLISSSIHIYPLPLFTFTDSMKTPRPVLTHTLVIDFSYLNDMDLSVFLKSNIENFKGLKHGFKKMGVNKNISNN
jgi:hypothetical protein